MKRTNAIAVVILAGAAFAAGRWAQPLESSALAQPEKKPAAKQPAKQPEPPAQEKAPEGMDPAMMEKMAKAMDVGEHHKPLTCLLGTWEGSVKIWMAPGTEPMESTGTVTRELKLGDRFLFETVKADTAMGPFNAIGIVGYNTVDGHYESVWLEDHATYMSTAKGKYDWAKKTFTFEGDMLDPMTGTRSAHTDMIDVSDPARHTMVGYSVGPDGKKFKSFEGVFEKTR